MAAKARFFTCADKGYEDFAILYIASILAHVADASVEIGVEDVPGFQKSHGHALEVLRQFFPAEPFMIRPASFRAEGRPIKANTVRFVETPERSEYIYIGDIDIIILETDLVEKHLAFMKKTGLPYSNSVREPDPSRMSGLHFTRYDVHYPLPALGDLDLNRMNDEQVLRIICERKGLPINHTWFRPVHGIHVSPNRAPHRQTVNDRVIPGWGITPYAAPYRNFVATPLMTALRPTLSRRLGWVLDVLDFHVGLAAEDPGPFTSGAESAS